MTSGSIFNLNIKIARGLKNKNYIYYKMDIHKKSLWEDLGKIRIQRNQDKLRLEEGCITQEEYLNKKKGLDRWAEMCWDLLDEVIFH